MAKIKPITVSFKNNEDDKRLYEWISSKSNFSGFIKDILKVKMEEELTGEVIRISKEGKDENKLIDLSNF